MSHRTNYFCETPSRRSSTIINILCLRRLTTGLLIYLQQSYNDRSVMIDNKNTGFIGVFPKWITEFSKNISHYSKGTQTCHSATSCVKDKDDTKTLARHMWETGSLNWAQFMLQWFIRFPEFNGSSESLRDVICELETRSQNSYLVTD